MITNVDDHKYGEAIANIHSNSSNAVCRALLDDVVADLQLALELCGDLDAEDVAWLRTEIHKLITAAEQRHKEAV